MAPDPKPATIETSDEFTVLVGATMTLAGHQFTIAPQDVEQLAEGSFEIKVPEDEKRAIGTFVDFYSAIRTTVGEDALPELSWDGLPEPLSNLVTGQVTLREFHLKVVKADVKRLLLDVTLATEWKPEGINFELDNVRINVEYEPS